jgi:hypothetical protein
MEAWIYPDRIDFRNAATLRAKVLNELRTPFYPGESQRVLVAHTPEGMRLTILRHADVSEAEIREVCARHNIGVAPRCEYNCCDLPTKLSFDFNDRTHYCCPEHLKPLFKQVTGKDPK